MKSKRNYIHEDFLLQSESARRLYHEFAADMPIIDYHCHLPPKEIAEDKRWENLTQLWIYGDHYKWRAMRSNGIDEQLITGDSDDRAKFEAFAQTMPYLLRNPLFDWAQLELSRYFGIHEILSPGTADEIWEKTCEHLASSDFSARQLMLRSNVKMVGTTDDPTDSLEYHRQLEKEGFPVKVLPSWRPDKAFAIDKPDFWNGWLEKLESASRQDISTYGGLLTALKKRHDLFRECGCCISDYGIETVPAAAPYSAETIDRIFDKARSGGQVTKAEADQFVFELITECGRMDAAAGWTWQIHYGGLRNNNSHIFKSLGPDSGCDSIGDWPIAAALSRLLDRLDSDDSLPKTIIYTLNPSDNEVIGTMIGNFQRGPTPGKIQFGSGWWFNDQRDGMLRQIEALSQLGLLSRFVGMLTDSRSFTSYTRHDYFRRILCNLLGGEMDRGELPDDIDWIGNMVRDICYRNAKRYFDLDV